MPPSSKLATSRVHILAISVSATVLIPTSGSAFLAQSPQLAKQMAIAADFERVYEIGPVFRAEDSNTHRHMTEFMGLDLEMTIEEHYHEVMELLDGLFLNIFKGLRENYSKEIEAVRKQFPADEFKWREGPEGTLKFTFKEAIDLLVEDGVSREELDDIKYVYFLFSDFSVPNKLLLLVLRMKSDLAGSSKRSMTLITTLLTSSRWPCAPSIPCLTLRIQ